MENGHRGENNKIKRSPTQEHVRRVDPYDVAECVENVFGFFTYMFVFDVLDEIVKVFEAQTAVVEFTFI